MTPARLDRMKPRFRKRWYARELTASIAAARGFLGAADTWADPNRELHRAWLESLKRKRRQKRRGMKARRLWVERQLADLFEWAEGEMSEFFERGPAVTVERESHNRIAITAPRLHRETPLMFRLSEPDE